MNRLGLFLMLLACPVKAQLSVQSPALDLLNGVAGEDPSNAPTRESSQEQAALGFSIKTLRPVGFVSPNADDEQSSAPVIPAMPNEEEFVPVQKPPMIFSGVTPFKGLTLYTAKADPEGTGRTEKPDVKPPIARKWVWGALGAGAAATIGGLFFPPLLFVGGLLLGAGAVLWFINRKVTKK
jgi:hypothetical protein